MLRKLRALQEEFSKENDALIKKYGKLTKNEKGEDQHQVPTDDPKFPEFKAIQDKLLDADSGLTLQGVYAHELDGKTNQIPIDLIALMFDTGIVLEDPTPDFATKGVKPQRTPSFAVKRAPVIDIQTVESTD